ncbi:MAG TPA: choice-of-anchor L domain-containing protein [Flavobacterium sp.]|jgi:gliding motility-associated-like protein
MKKFLLLLFALAFHFEGFSQAITVNTNTYSVPQLVTNVLINSPCVSVTNITWRTGTNFGSSNGIGYFENTNPNFPMQSGVILTTGSAMNSEGPNSVLLSDGSANWIGDVDLEATLAAAGIPMVSTNATLLEFDFTPISSSFSFDFIFASEEYGNYQCQFSDAFAFLLTNMNTGVTTNLAVVPSTSTPISVVTIRDFLYNSSCPSANAQYFGLFNGGSAAAGSPTNFNGQTELLNASAALVPNTPYHIKLVIADRTDYESDSAIFLSSDSFNLGQDVLGADLTVANNTAICPGSSYLVQTNLNPSTNLFSWANASGTILGETGPSLTVTAPGTYSVTYDDPSDTCPPRTSDILIEFYPELAVGTPSDLYRCDTGAATYSYNLAFNTPIVSAGITPAPTVSYHASLNDANNNLSPLASPYVGTPGQTIFVRVKGANSNCYVVKQFILNSTAGPIATQPQNLTACRNSIANPHGSFELVDQTPAILNGQSPTTNAVTYHTTLADAQAGTSPITATYFGALNGTTVYVRVQNVFDPSCYSTTSFQLFVNPLPLVDTLPPVIVCESYVLPVLTNGNYFTAPYGGGTPLFAGDIISETQTIYIFNQTGGVPNCSASSSFQVTIIDPLQAGPGSGTYCTSYALPGLQYGNYYTQGGGNGTQIPVGTPITTTQTIHVYYVSPTPPYCEVDTEFTITLIPRPDVPAYPNVMACSAYILPSLPIGNYYTGPNGTGTMLSPGTAITTPQNIYVYAESGTSPVNCTDQDSFYVNIGFNTPADISQCGPYTLPELPGNGKYFTGPNGTGTELLAGSQVSTSQTVYIHFTNSDCPSTINFHITVSQPPVDTLADVSVCDSYILPALTNGTYYSGPGGTGSVLNAGDIIDTTQTIYIYAELDSTCSNESSFTVTKIPPPAIDSRSDIDICNSYTLTALTAGNYFTGPNGTGTMLPAGTVLTESQTVYIYAESNTSPACSAQNSFELFIFSVEADDPTDVVACDSYVLPPLTIGNYYILPGGPSNGEGTMMYAGDVVTATMDLWVYIESGERINCHDENQFSITINNTPVLPPFPDRFACNAYTLPALTQGNYFTAPGGTGTMLNAGDQVTSSQTLYVFAETATVPNCTDEESFDITVFNVDEQPDVLTCGSFVLPALTAGKYYTGPGATGTQLPAGSPVSTDQTIYIYAASPFTPTCYDESSFDVLIIPTPVANPVPASLTTVCDEDGNNDGDTSFDLTALNATVLGTQTGAEFSITYYETLADANAGLSSITTTSSHDVYVRVDNSLAPNCYDLQSIHITVNKLPVPTPEGGIICFDTETQTLLGAPFTIHSGLSTGHTFKWFNEAGDQVGTGANYVAHTPGTYTVIAKRTATGCISEPVSATVAQSEPALVSYTVTEDFSDNQDVTVVAVGTGNYEYQLDFGDFQDSPVFENVSSGIHTVNVRDKNGCDASSTTALVVNYPHYFTPNGDGIHDTWNIVDLSDQLSSDISIYDRFGKLITQIKPSGLGWDGTYNGHQMPSTDYWFVVNYTEDGLEKEFRAHFSMKR